MQSRRGFRAAPFLIDERDDGHVTALLNYCIQYARTGGLAYSTWHDGDL
ncbi:hypothetical protein NDI44_25975 [Trichocoleus sp. DQ-A3]|nr:hypothetical protein [Coleofasciculus sp. FACHB-125]MBD1903480.1 hypothetical protein [Coleofasciculus sp. FACHB-125]